MAAEYFIIEAHSNDQEKIISLVNDAYWRKQEPYFIDVPASRERLNSVEFSRLLKDAAHTIFLLMENNDILGVIAVEIPQDEEYAKLTLFAMQATLAEKQTGKRLGRLLIAHAENYALERGRKMMKIEVLAFAARLADYYVELGYALTGKASPFFHEECIRPAYQNSSKLYLNEMIKILKNQEKTMLSKLIPLFLAAAPLAAATSQPPQAQETFHNHISAEQLKSWYDQNKAMVVLDARSKPYFNGTLLPGAKWVAAESTDKEIETAVPSKESLIVVYCHSDTCPASGWLYDKLTRLGYKNVYEYKGGLVEWMKLGYPTVKQPSPF